MFWTGVILGVFVGVNAGVMLGCLLASARRSELEYQLESSTVDVAVMEAAREADWRTLRPIEAAYAAGNPYMHSPQGGD
jgi:uncharacterized lipoprotein YajG